MSVMIGIDPHKLLHAACAIDRSEEELSQLQVRSGQRQLSELLSWATRFEQRTWAIESAGGLSYLLAQQLLGHGETVLDVPPTLSARVRVLGSGRSNKNDANDARAVAIAALRSRSVAAVRAEDHVSVLRLLAKAQLDASRARSRACSRLHALVRELVPGGIRKEIVAGQALQVLNAIEPVNATQRQRLELARETLEEIELLDARMKRSKQRITDAVKSIRHHAHRRLRDRPDHRRDDHRLHRRHRSIPDLGSLRRLQRDRADRVLIIGSNGAPTVASREPDLEPCDPHDRRDPDPPPRQRGPRLLRSQGRRGPHQA